MNPSMPQSYIDQHMAEDPARAAGQYLAESRSDLEAFVLREAVEACVPAGVRERPPVAGVHYVDLCYPLGGSADSMTLAIGHVEQDRETAVIDAVRCDDTHCQLFGSCDRAATLIYCKVANIYFNTRAQSIYYPHIRLRQKVQIERKVMT
jgi:hypothetical protein